MSINKVAAPLENPPRGCFGWTGLPMCRRTQHEVCTLARFPAKRAPYSLSQTLPTFFWRRMDWPKRRRKKVMTPHHGVHLVCTLFYTPPAAPLRSPTVPSRRILYFVRSHDLLSLSANEQTLMPSQQKRLPTIRSSRDVLWGWFGRPVWDPKHSRMWSVIDVSRQLVGYRKQEDSLHATWMFKLSAMPVQLSDETQTSVAVIFAIDKCYFWWVFAPAIRTSPCNRKLATSQMFLYAEPQTSMCRNFNATEQIADFASVISRIHKLLYSESW